MKEGVVDRQAWQALERETLQRHMFEKLWLPP